MKETWAEFAERVKPKDGDTFMDRRGNYWVYRYRAFYCGEASVSVSSTGSLLDCPIIEVKKPVLWARGWYFDDNRWHLSPYIFKSLDALKEYHSHRANHKWPALPNAEGYYVQPEDE